MKRAAITYRFAEKAPPYAEAVRAAGIEPVLVHPEGGVFSLDNFGGLLLSGGTDVDAALYGEERHPLAEDPDAERDVMEQRFVREALDRDLPVLAICRGAQLLNVTHPGGTLAQHIEGHAVRGGDAALAVHQACIEPGSRLAGIFQNLQVGVNSRHHQAVGQAGRGLLISARAEDGVVEGLERPDRRFVVAVQWHPEDQISRYPIQLRLFQAFADAI